jgi:hypothetical protein
VTALAPADFPLPFDEMAIRILYTPCPKDVPVSGVYESTSISSFRSLFNEGYFFKSFLNNLLKSGVGITL